MGQKAYSLKKKKEEEEEEEGKREGDLFLG
jgi:hypothetical protein